MPRKATTRSRSPADVERGHRHPRARRTGASSSQLRSMLRYQLSAAAKARCGRTRPRRSRRRPRSATAAACRVGVCSRKPAAPRHHADRVGTMPTAGVAARVARARVEDAADGGAHVALELRLRHARLLEVELVEDRVVGLRHRRWWGAWSRAAGTARSARSRRGTGRGAAAPRATPPARPSRGRRSPRSARRARRAAPPCRPPGARACTARSRRARRSGRSRACPAPPRGSRPRPARASWWRQEYQDSGKPWQSRTSGPSPCSATCMRMPLVSTIRCWTSLIVWPAHGDRNAARRGSAVRARGRRAPPPRPPSRNRRP